MPRILIVDDEKSIRLTLAEFLRQAGYAVETAEDAGQAQRLLGQGDFDVVVTDIVLPLISGVELLRKIRSQAPEALVLMMTGEPTVETAAEAVRAGAYDYLTKPISKKVILRVVARAVQLKSLQDEKRRLEAANREYQAGLERMVEERTRALRESEAQLHQAQKMEAIGQLAGGVAHDFNNLLTIISLYSQIALERLEADHPVRSQIAGIKHAGERAASLTRQLLIFSRKQVVQPRLLSLNLIASELEKMLRRLIGEDIALVMHLDPALRSVRADPGYLEQVIMNLVVNAHDAMPNGGTLTLQTANAALDEAQASQQPGASPGEYVALTVTDTGCGMTEEVKARIFEPFFTTKGEGKGTGLGLATVYGIAQQSGGHITVRSAPGEGTTFTIYLPAIAENAPEHDAPSPGAKPPRGSETVLVVEDDEKLCGLIKFMLEHNGYTVLTAASGVEALAKFGDNPQPIDLVITDMVMPGLDGASLIKSLSRVRPGIKVLCMSGYTEHAALRSEITDHDTEFLRKPFTFDSLAHKIRHVLDRPATPPAGT